MVRASGLVSPVSGRPIPVARAYVDPDATARSTPRTGWGPVVDVARGRADEDETTECRAEHQHPRPARALPGGDALADGQQHRRQTERHHRRDGHADGERRRRSTAPGRRPCSSPTMTAVPGRCRIRLRRSAKPRVTSRAAKSTTAASSIRQVLTTSTDIGSRSRMSCMTRPPVPQSTPARDTWRRPRRAGRGGRARETRGHGRAASDVGTRGRLSSSRSPTQLVGGVPLRSGSRRAYDEAVSDHVRDPATSQRSAPSSSRTNSWPRSPSIRVRWRVDHAEADLAVDLVVDGERPSERPTSRPKSMHSLTFSHGALTGSSSRSTSLRRQRQRVAGVVDLRALDVEDVAAVVEARQSPDGSRRASRPRPGPATPTSILLHRARPR